MPTGQVAVVDEDDNVIAIKDYRDVTERDIIRVSVVWLENSKSEVLLQQRALTKKLGPGLWGPAAAGTVELHETYLSNIIKEAEEELGLAGLKPIAIGKRLYWEPDGRFGRMFMFYKGVIDKPIEDFTIPPDEVAQIKWVAKDELLKDVAKNRSVYVPSAVLWKEVYY